MLRTAFAMLAFVSLTLQAGAQEDALGIPGPIHFDSTSYALVWTSNPSPVYYKQEYLADGQALDSYDEMFLIDVLLEGASPQSAAADMVASLTQRRGSDPVVNHELIGNAATGEFILDFLISDASSGTTIVEWNAYRYVPRESGLVLYGLSRRGYGEGAIDFLRGMGEWRTQTIQALATMELPPIELN
jgi:hypothetical protein